MGDVRRSAQVLRANAAVAVVRRVSGREEGVVCTRLADADRVGRIELAVHARETAREAIAGTLILGGMSLFKLLFKAV